MTNFDMAQQIAIRLKGEELATLLTALESEWEHARDAARDAEGDDAQVGHCRAIAARNDRLRTKLASLAR